ncbi:MAG: flagellar hook-length control protein FliK [Brevinematales bacterium]|nr:flagellar hook-length control protein FliK [Brevinematales bacterium]
MNTMIFPFLAEKPSSEKVKAHEPKKEVLFPSSEREIREKSEFASTLKRVSSEKKDKTPSLPPSHETIHAIREKVRHLSQHPESQTEENITQILEALLAFLTQGVQSLQPEVKQEASQLLTSLQNMVAMWEKGSLSSQDFLKQLLNWLDEASSSFLGSVSLSLSQDKGTSSPDLPSPPTKEAPSENTFLSSPKEKENSHTPHEKPLLKVVDKRSFSPITSEKPPMDSLPSKESFSSKIDALLKEKNLTEGILSPLTKPVQDFGIKTSPVLPSLPRVSVEYMLQQVAGKAFITLRDGQSEMRLQLTPPDLGRMEMKIVLEDGQMMGKIVVSTPEAKALFDQNLGELQRQLQQAGVQVGSLDVSLGQPGREKSDQPSIGETRYTLDGKGETQGTLETLEKVRSSLWADSQVNYIV